jgi:hypothetical protein
VTAGRLGGQIGKAGHLPLATSIPTLKISLAGSTIADLLFISYCYHNAYVQDDLIGGICSTHKEMRNAYSMLV